MSPSYQRTEDSSHLISSTHGSQLQSKSESLPHCLCFPLSSVVFILHQWDFRLPSPFCSGHWVVYPLICSIYPLLSSLKIISDYFGVRCSCLQYHIMLQFPFPKSGFLSQTCVTKTLHLPHFFSPQIHCLLKHYALTSWEWRFNLHGRMLTDWRGISLSLCDTFPQTHVLDILAQHSW